MALYKYPEALQRFLKQPVKVAAVCLTLAVVSMITNGTFLKLYNLHRDKNTLRQQIAEMNANILETNKQLKMAKDPAYIERQAADLYDLAEEHDLMFVFADE